MALDSCSSGPKNDKSRHYLVHDACVRCTLLPIVLPFFFFVHTKKTANEQTAKQKSKQTKMIVMYTQFRCMYVYQRQAKSTCRHVCKFEIFHFYLASSVPLQSICFLSQFAAHFLRFFNKMCTPFLFDVLKCNDF